MNELRQTIQKQRVCAAKYDPKRSVTNLLRRKIETTLPNGFNENLLCAGDRSSKGTCAGDSGAPLIVHETVDYDTLEVKFKLIAILHGGIVSCDNSVYPALYNRVAAPENYHWILETIPGAGNIDV